VRPAISNTSPLLYLRRIDVREWLPQLFSEVWIPQAVVSELDEGQRRGYDVLDPNGRAWLRQVYPRQMPSEGGPLLGFADR
jgi:predicted nucleic acid-binding protein